MRKYSDNTLEATQLTSSRKNINISKYPLADGELEKQFQQGNSAELTEVREHIQRASSILRTLGDEYERVGWLLEDAMMYLDSEEIATHQMSFEDREALIYLTQEV